jgi:hypothetical protein
MPGADCFARIMSEGGALFPYGVHREGLKTTRDIFVTPWIRVRMFRMTKKVNEHG